MKIYPLITVFFFFMTACSFTDEDQLKNQLRYRGETIKKLKAANQRLERKIVALSLLNQKKPVIIDAANDQDIDKAFDIVKEFSTAIDNVDSTENKEFIGNLIEDIDPVNSNRKVSLLLFICREYTPTDTNYAEPACNKLRLYGDLLFPGVPKRKILSSDSPLLSAFN